MAQMSCTGIPVTPGSTPAAFMRVVAPNDRTCCDSSLRPLTSCTHTPTVLDLHRSPRTGRSTCAWPHLLLTTTKSVARKGAARRQTSLLHVLEGNSPGC